jgi:hypothetical protein
MLHVYFSAFPDAVLTLLISIAPQLRSGEVLWRFPIPTCRAEFRRISVFVLTTTSTNPQASLCALEASSEALLGLPKLIRGIL